MAAYTEKRLYGPLAPGTTAGTGYTTPAATTTIIKQVVMANTTATDAWVTVRLVPTGQTTGAAFALAEGLVIPANGTSTLDLAQVMNAADFLSLLQQTASAIVVTISGLEKA